MAEKIQYGILGGLEIERNDNGYIRIPVVIQDSGLYCGSAPNELRIRNTLSPHDSEFNKQWVAKLNRQTDLPYRLAIAEIKIVEIGKALTDRDLLNEGIEPLDDEKEK